jgi:hypothetical protein
VRAKGDGLTELVARYGNDGADYFSAAVEHLQIRPKGYCLTLAWERAVVGGYDLTTMAKLDEHDSQAHGSWTLDGFDH